MALSFNYQGEEQLKASGMAYTILRPASFMQNFLFHYSPTIKAQGTVYQSLGDARMAIIDTRDIGDVAVAVLTSAGHEGKTYELTGPEALTYSEAAEKIGAATGRAVRYIDVPAAAYEQVLMSIGVPPVYAAEVVNIYGRGPYREGKKRDGLLGGSRNPRPSGAFLRRVRARVCRILPALVLHAPLFH